MKIVKSGQTGEAKGGSLGDAWCLQFYKHFGFWLLSECFSYKQAMILCYQSYGILFPISIVLQESVIFNHSLIQVLFSARWGKGSELHLLKKIIFRESISIQPTK